MVVIVGAGLAGLVCARVLHDAGVPVLLLEGEVLPGGRVRTDQHPEGFLLDRGFQVLFTAYPAAQRHLSFTRLALQPFVPGALIARNGKLYPLADPRRAPSYLPRTLRAPLFGLSDKLRVAPLALAARRAGIKRIFAEPDRTTEEYLTEQGFSSAFIDSFARPFYGGIFLDRSLSTSSAMFRFTFKMLAEGDTVLPAKGMQEIAEQLAKALPVDAISYGVTVEQVVRDGGRAVGVRLQDGHQIAADAVVVATDPHTAARLLDNPDLPHQPVSCTTAYFASPASLYADRMIVLNANPNPYINNLVQISNVAPSYAPRGQHLISATMLNAGADSDEEIERRCLADLELLFPGKGIAALRLLRIYRIPFAQFAQPPGIFGRLPGNETDLPNLYLASEVTASSSIQGAMASGEAAAQRVLSGTRSVAGGMVPGSA